MNIIKNPDLGFTTSPKNKTEHILDNSEISENNKQMLDKSNITDEFAEKASVSSKNGVVEEILESIHIIEERLPSKDKLNKENVKLDKDVSSSVSEVVVIDESQIFTPRGKWNKATSLRFEQIEISMKTGQSFKQIIG